MAPKITLYAFAPSQNAIRPEIVLREKGLEFEKVVLNLFDGDHKKPDFLAINPRGQVPTLIYEDGGGPIAVYESIATIRFLDDMVPSPPLLPPVSEPRRRAQALIRMEEFQAKLDHRNIFGSVLFGRKTREELGARVDDLMAELERWNEYVGGQSYLAGEQFTLADVAVFPLLLHFEAMGYDYERRTPALSTYLRRCKERPSVVESGWLDVFAAFVAERKPDPVLA